MTFLDGVVNVVSIETTTAGNQFNTFYTVPSGRFAMISIEVLEFESSSSANNLRLTRNGELIRLFDPTSAGQRVGAIETGTNQFYMRSGDSLQLRASTSSVDNRIFCTVLEYNLP